MGDRLVGCASYTMSEFHVRNYMARRPHINQEPNVGTSAVANMCAELIECHTSGQTKEEYHVWKSSKKPVFLRLLLRQESSRLIRGRIQAIFHLENKDKLKKSVHT